MADTRTTDELLAALSSQDQDKRISAVEELHDRLINDRLSQDCLDKITRLARKKPPPLGVIQFFYFTFSDISEPRTSSPIREQLSELWKDVENSLEGDLARNALMESRQVHSSRLSRDEQSRLVRRICNSFFSTLGTK